MNPVTNNAIEIRQLNKRFHDFSLKNVSFILPRGYIMGFIGPNGAGKSTTIKLMMNLLRKDSGEIKILGLDHQRHEKDVKEQIGFVYDEGFFYEELTLGETARMMSRFYRHWEDSTFADYLKKFQVNPSLKIKELSKGMKMKFSLAVALSHQAKLLIMDEPTSGLDPIVRSELLEILSWLMQDEEKAIFFSTHITSDLEKTADYITMIHQGEIVFSQSKEALFDEYHLVKGPKSLLTAPFTSHLAGIKENSFGFEGLYKGPEHSLLPREQIAVARPTLEEIMFYIIKEGKG